MPIFDQGYQHWTGELSGHTWRWLAVARHGVRVGMKNPVLRIVLMLSWLPAIALAFVLCIYGLLERKSEMVMPIIGFLSLFDPQVIAEPLKYRVEVWTLSFDYFLHIELWFSMVVILLVGPNLISQDLRFNALPLYFSRPLRRIDYFVGKLGVVGWFLGMVLILPSLIAYALGLLFSLDLTIIRDTMMLLLSCIAYGAVMILSAGLLILALSSISRNSRYIALAWLAFFFVGSITAQTLDWAAMAERQDAARQLANNRPPSRQPNAPPPPPAEQSKHAKARNRGADQILAEAELKAAKTNWRPLVAYTANLSRIGRELLNTDAAWESLSKNRPENDREAFLVRNTGPQYPWYWSAGVLAVLFGLSAWILNRRVRSLDRLR